MIIYILNCARINFLWDRDNHRTLAITNPNFYKLCTTVDESRNRFDLVKNCSIPIEE
jgi:hypothetical protein